jgi:hypothetical protein
MPRQPLRHMHRRAGTGEQSTAASQGHLQVNHTGAGGESRTVCGSRYSVGDDRSTFERHTKTHREQSRWVLSFLRASAGDCSR